MDLPGPLVDVGWMLERLGAPGLVVADVRWVPDGTGRSAYESGHIPGAVYLDVDADLSDPPGGGRGRHPLPSAEDFAHTMSEGGVSDDNAVVAYDDAGGSHAVRLWWMLEVTGHRAAVLDGALSAWTGPRETGSARRPPASFSVRPWPAVEIVDADEVEALLREGAAVVLDARAPERYRAEIEPFDPRAGHIPGALSAPWTENLDPLTGRFLPPDELHRRYEALRVRAGPNTVAYCGSGIASCHDGLAMEVAGLGRPRLYVGSWSQWSSDPDRPAATGDEP